MADREAEASKGGQAGISRRGDATAVGGLDLGSELDDVFYTASATYQALVSRQSALLRLKKEIVSLSEAVAVRLMVAIPAAQRCVSSVIEKGLERWRFNVAVAKYHVGFSPVPGIGVFCASSIGLFDARFPAQLNWEIIHNAIVAKEIVADRHHVIGAYHRGLGDRRIHNPIRAG